MRRSQRFPKYLLIALPLLCASLGRAQSPATLNLQTQELYAQDFEAQTSVPAGVKDDSAWAGGRVPLRVVDSGDPRRGKVLEATASGYAQVSLGEFSLEAGAMYRVSVEMSARGTRDIEVGLREVSEPYTMHDKLATQVFESARTIQFFARARSARPSRLQFVMRGTTTLLIDSIRVEKIVGGLPEGFQPDDPAGMLLPSQPPSPRNMLLNSGFELGRDGFFSRGKVEFAPDVTAFEGRRVLKLNAQNAEVTSAWHKLSVHFDYQIVARVKAVGGTAKIDVGWGDYVNFRGGINGKSQSFEVTPEEGWKRIAWTWRPSPTRGQVDPYRLYYLSLANRSSGGENAPQVLVDAVQARVVGGDVNSIKTNAGFVVGGSFANADDEEYAPLSPAEMSITTDAPYNVATEGEVVRVQVLAAQDGPVQLSVVDESGKAARTQKLEVRGSVATATLEKLPPGYWKLSAGRFDKKGSHEGDGENFLCVVPKMPVVSLDAWHFGTHARADANMQAACWKLGWHWNRLHDTSHATKWPDVEPRQNEWKWRDEEVAQLKQPAAGMSFGLLGSLDRVPAWAPKNSKNPGAESGTESLNGDSMSLWSEYCRRTAEHWKGLISQWEVTNEPNLSGMSAEHYRQVLEAAAQSVKAGNPDAKIVGLGGAVPAGSPWLAQVIKAGGWKSSDAFSFHNYGGTTWSSQSGPANITAAIESLRAALREAGANNASAPILDSESGLIVRSSFSKYLQPFGDSDPEDAARMMPKAVASVIASGLSRWFYYAAFDTSHPGENAGFTVGDINGAIKMPFQPMAVAIAHLEGKSYAGRDEQILPAEIQGTFAMKFTGRGSDATLAWSNAREGATISIPRGATVLSMWGRAMKPESQVKLSEAPIYILRAAK